MPDTDLVRELTMEPQATVWNTSATKYIFHSHPFLTFYTITRLQ